MFWALNGATETPSRCSHRQIPAVSTLLPASEVVPATNSDPIAPTLPAMSLASTPQQTIEPTARRVRTVDYHTGGEPFRIVLDGVPEIPGTTRSTAARMPRPTTRWTSSGGCSARSPAAMPTCTAASWCPRTRWRRVSCPLTWPVLFWHKDGYSTACGHGTIALGAWAVHSGLVAAEPDGETEVRIDVPSGRVIARVRCTGGRVSAVTFRNVPSWVVARSVPVPTSRGHVTVDVAYGGAIYATLPAAAVGLAVTPEHDGELIAIGREIKWALNEHEVARSPE